MNSESVNSQESTTYYDILEVSPNASHAVIKAAYKSLMQRYHPDKNSGDPAMGKLTILISQAFDVLSDPEKRKAYDLGLAQHELNNSTSMDRVPRTESGVVTTQQAKQLSPSQEVLSRPLDRTTKSATTVWLVIYVAFLWVAIVMAIMALPKIQTNSEAQHQPLSEKVEAEELARLAKVKAETEKKEAVSKAARTIPQLAEGITVSMPPSKDGSNHCSEYAICTHYIEIPVLGVVVRKNDSEKIIQHIWKNRALILESVETELGKHLYTNLTQVNGEEMLKKIILDQINQTVVGTDNYELNDVSEYRGIEEILLPESFSVH